MKATQQLKNEHQSVELMLAVLEEAAERLELKNELNTEHLSGMVEFLKGFVDKCHHGKEEDILFPELEKMGVPKEAGPIGVMLNEHSEGRGYIRELSLALELLKKGEPLNKVSGSIIFSAKQYIVLLKSHIIKENEILFAIADERISKERQNELYEAFEELEENRIGIGKHEEYHRLLESLTQEYLSKSHRNETHSEMHQHI